jgi:hypothetical protein
MGPVDGVEATTLSDGSASSWTVEQPGAVVRVPTTRERVDVAVRVDGYRPAVVSDVADRANVTLQPAFRVRLALGPLPQEFSGRTPCQLSLERRDRRFPSKWTEVERFLREGREWTVRFPFAGKYVGRVGFVDTPSDRTLDMVPIAPFVVDDSSEEQTRTLVVEPTCDEHRRLTRAQAVGVRGGRATRARRGAHRRRRSRRARSACRSRRARSARRRACRGR